MNPEIRPSLRIFASYALLLCALYALFQFLLVPAHIKTTEARTSLIALTEQNSRFTAAIQQYEEALHEIAADDPGPKAAAPGRLLHALTPALAGAGLQALLKTLVMDSNAVLTASAIIEGERSGKLQKLSVNLRLQSSLESLVTFLHYVERQEQALFFDNLVIQSHHRRGSIVQSKADELEVRLDIYGFMELSAGSDVP